MHTFLSQLAARLRRLAGRFEGARRLRRAMHQLGQMSAHELRDIGLGDWLFDLDKPEELARVPSAALMVAKEPVAAKAKAARAREFVQKRQRETMTVLQRASQPV